MNFVLFLTNLFSERITLNSLRLDRLVFLKQLKSFFAIFCTVTRQTAYMSTRAIVTRFLKNNHKNRSSIFFWTCQTYFYKPHKGKLFQEARLGFGQKLT